MSQINTKSIARIAAIQTLYNFENNNFEPDLDTSISKIMSFYKDMDVANDLGIEWESKIRIKPNYNFLKQLVQVTYDDLQDIDFIITDHLTNDWTIDKFSILLKSLLRVAIGELKFFPETPSKIIVSEYTNIASDMLDDIEVGFVNSILDTCSKKIRS